VKDFSRNDWKLVLITIYSKIILDETQSLQRVAGLLLAFIGAIIVNFRFERKSVLVVIVLVFKMSACYNF